MDREDKSQKIPKSLIDEPQLSHQKAMEGRVYDPETGQYIKVRVPQTYVYYTDSKGNIVKLLA